MDKRSDTRRYDVVIIGAGIAGGSLALALSDADFHVALVEAGERPGAPPLAAAGVDDFDPRVSALTPQSRQLLQRLRAWDGVAEQRVCEYAHMSVWDAEGTGRIDFDSSELNCEVLGYIAENRVVLHALAEELDACPEVRRLQPARLSSCTANASGVTVSLEDGRELQADLLVAADGALSAVREQLGFATREWDYGHRALVATVELENSHRHTAWQRFLISGPLALLPLPDDGSGRHFCSIVWSCEEALAEELLAMDDAAFCDALSRASEYCLGKVLHSSARFSFPLRQRHAVDYVQPGVALVGDAAHTIHPLAGQGVNLGLKDVAVLAEEIVAARERGLSPGSLDCLGRYQRRRKGDNLLMMAAMDGFKRLFAQRALPLRWLRNVGMREVSRIAPLKRRIMRHAMGLGN